MTLLKGKRKILFPPFALSGATSAGLFVKHKRKVRIMYKICIIKDTYIFNTIKYNIKYAFKEFSEEAFIISFFLSRVINFKRH